MLSPLSESSNLGLILWTLGTDSTGEFITRRPRVRKSSSENENDPRNKDGNEGRKTRVIERVNKGVNITMRII